jgi:uncharacterized membrane protein (UPF0127 family)
MRAPGALVTCFWLAVGGAQAFAADLPGHFAGLAQADVSIVTGSGTHRFRVWVADDDLSRQRGLMHVRELPVGRGMLFLFDDLQFASFWMKNTYVPLDLAFIDADGIVVNVAVDTKPQSLDPIRSIAPVGSVLELAAGTASRIGLKPGDRLTHTVPGRPESR